MSTSGNAIPDSMHSSSHSALKIYVRDGEVLDAPEWPADFDVVRVKSGDCLLEAQREKAEFEDNVDNASTVNSDDVPGTEPEDEPETQDEPLPNRRWTGLYRCLGCFHVYDGNAQCMGDGEKCGQLEPVYESSDAESGDGDDDDSGDDGDDAPAAKVVPLSDAQIKTLRRYRHAIMKLGDILMEEGFEPEEIANTVVDFTTDPNGDDVPESERAEKKLELYFNAIEKLLDMLIAKSRGRNETAKADINPAIADLVDGAIAQNASLPLAPLPEEREVLVPETPLPSPKPINSDVFDANKRFAAAAWRLDKQLDRFDDVIDHSDIEAMAVYTHETVASACFWFQKCCDEDWHLLTLDNRKHAVKIAKGDWPSFKNVKDVKDTIFQHTIVGCSPPSDKLADDRFNDANKVVDTLYDIRKEKKKRKHEELVAEHKRKYETRVEKSAKKNRSPPPEEEYDSSDEHNMTDYEEWETAGLGEWEEEWATEGLRQVQSAWED